MNIARLDPPTTFDEWTFSTTLVCFGMDPMQDSELYYITLLEVVLLASIRLHEVQSRLSHEYYTTYVCTS